MATRSIPHRVVQAGVDGDLQLGPHPVGGGDDQGVLEPRRLGVEHRPEPAQRGQRPRPRRGLGQGLDRLHQGCPGVDIDAGLRIGQAIGPLGPYSGSASNVGGEAWPHLRRRPQAGAIASPMTPITDNARLIEFCRAVAHSEFLAVDTEFMRETTYWPKLCLIQAACVDGQAVIDPLAEGLDLEPFLALMRDHTTSPRCSTPPARMWRSSTTWGAIPHTALRHSGGGPWRQASASRSPMTPWCARCCASTWTSRPASPTGARRPLSDAQLTYALADVTHLAKLYPKLRERLEKAGRLAWVAEEMAALSDPGFYDMDPERAWRRLKPP